MDANNRAYENMRFYYMHNLFLLPNFRKLMDNSRPDIHLSEKGEQGL